MADINALKTTASLKNGERGRHDSDNIRIEHHSQAAMDKDWPFEVIKHNAYLIPRYREQEEFVCVCSPSSGNYCDGGCLNRSLMIECDRKTYVCSPFKLSIYFLK